MKFCDRIARHAFVPHRLCCAARCQARARRAYHLFLDHPEHSSLRFKKVDQSENVYSVRIGLGYRALGVLEGSTIIWFGLGRTPIMIA